MFELVVLNNSIHPIYLSIHPSYLCNYINLTHLLSDVSTWGNNFVFLSVLGLFIYGTIDVVVIDDYDVDYDDYDGYNDCDE
jgi:hypothetical protein